MRSSELIKILYDKIQKYGDLYVTYESENSEYGMEKIEEIAVVPLHETKYLCIK